MSKKTKNIAKQMFGGLVGAGLVLGVMWLVGATVHFLENNPIWILPLLVLIICFLHKELS